MTKSETERGVSFDPKTEQEARELMIWLFGPTYKPYIAPSSKGKVTA